MELSGVLKDQVDYSEHLLDINGGRHDCETPNTPSAEMQKQAFIVVNSYPTRPGSLHATCFHVCVRLAFGTKLSVRLKARHREALAGPRITLEILVDDQVVFWLYSWLCIGSTP